MNTEIVVTNDIININVTDQIIIIEAPSGAYPLPSGVYSVYGRTGNVVAQEGDYNLTLMGDVTISSPSTGQVLRYNGTTWVNSTESYVGTVTSVAATVPTGLTISGSPITSAGTLAFGLASGYSIPTTASQTTWDTAYTRSLTSASVTGTTTKTLTLNQQGGGTITASWSDLNTDAVTSVFGRTGAVVATSGDYSTTLVTEGTNLYYTQSRFDTAFAAKSTTNLTEGTNLYYTDARARASNSFVAGSGAYNSTTGVITIPTNNNQITNGAGYITTADLTGYIPYTGATTSIDLNNQSVVNVSHLGINTTSVPTILFRAVGDNNSNSRIAMRGYSSNTNSSSIRVTKFRGTAASPQAPLSGDSLGKFELAGYGTTSSDGYPQASFEGLATENWGATARGSKTVIKVTPNTTITQVVALTINQDKSAVFENSITGTSLIKTGGTSIQFLKADGSVDSSSYITLASLSFAAGSGAYNSTTGVITIPTNNNQITNGSNYITLASLSATTPLSYNSSTGAFSISQSNTTTNGYLSFTDWNTFNGKQAALNGTGFVKASGTTISYDNSTYLTTISGITAGGELSGTYANPSLVNSAVTGKVLTGVNITGGTVVDTDSILTAFGKVQNQINGLIGGSIYKGTWNASTNTPTLTSSVGTSGNYYIVSVAGSTNLNGITDWQVGDWAIFQGSVWQKVDNTDSVVSVNGFTGAVSLTTSNISEGSNLYYTNARTIASSLTGYVSGAGTISASDTILTAIQKLNGNIGSLTTGVSSVFGRTGAVVSATGDYTTSQVTEGTNLYYTDVRARASLSFAAGSGAYNSTTGVITIPTNNSQITNGSNYITLTGLSSSATGLTYTNTTGVFSLTTGYVIPTTTSATNWDTAYTNRITSATTPLSITSNAISITQANTTTSGYLSSTDWNTFNGKQSTLTFSSPLVNTAGTVSIPAATTSVNGYLTSTDWTTFNNKQAALTNPVTGTGTSGYVTYFNGTSTVTGSSNLFWDNTNVRLGIGTNAPTDSLHLYKSGTIYQKIETVSGGAGTIYKRANSTTTDWIVGHGAASANENFEIYSASATAACVWTMNGAERLRLTSNGYLGISTSSPQTFGALAVRTSVSINSKNVSASFSDAANSTFDIRHPAANIVDLNSQDSAMTFSNTNSGSNGVERMRITTDGNVGVGITGVYSNVRLMTRGVDATASNYAFRAETSAAANLMYIRNDGLIVTGLLSGSPYNYTTSSAANMYVSGGGELQRSTSSLKYKTDVKDYDKGLSEVLQMRSVYYKGKNDGDTQFAGLIAEEIHDLGLTEFVQYAEDGTPDALAYSNMIALLTKAIQELSTQNQDLKSRLDKAGL